MFDSDHLTKRLRLGNDVDILVSVKDETIRDITAKLQLAEAKALAATERQVVA